MYVDLADMLGKRLFGEDGRSIVVAARLDQRCSYCLYAPPRRSEDAVLNNLLVYVHGEGRRFQHILNNLRALANASGYMIVCPLFPANILRDGNVEGYKYLREGDLRYDEILIDIVSEVRSAFEFARPRFLLGGFSGGAQFAHRFLYFYPELLEAVSIAAPGSVTLLDESLSWWPGIGSMERAFGRDIDFDELKRVELQLIIGEQDRKNIVSGPSPSNLYWTENWYVAGRNRVDRLRSLYSSLQGHELRAELNIVPGVGHSFLGLVPSIMGFFSQAGKQGAEADDGATASPAILSAKED